MEKAELVTHLSSLLEKYAQHRAYIEKAKGQTGKFSPAVIEKVVLDHEIKSSQITDEVTPIIAPLASLIQTLEGEKAQLDQSRGGVDEQVQEFDLRLAIGEIGQEEYDSSVAELRQTLDASSGRAGEIDGDLAALCGLRDRWFALNPSAAAPAAEMTDLPPGNSVDPVGTFASRTDIREDVSSIFSEGARPEGTRHPARVGVEEEIAIETAEVAEEPGDVQLGFDDGGDLDIVGSGVDAEGAEVEIDLGEGAERPAIAVTGPSESAESAAAAGEESQRRALLLYQEGTSEEQIYPFTGDTLTVGRGRENDIQIKNDSKVSRYHCKLFRRGNNFYIEDIKSSNGTLVNGELITDRRLFGGEEIIIGETFFRFRIME